MVFFLQLSHWSKNLALNLKRNKDLTFIAIIIDIDRYETNYSDHFLGHIAQPYLDVNLQGEKNIQRTLHFVSCVEFLFLILFLMSPCFAHALSAFLSLT